MKPFLQLLCWQCDFWLIQAYFGGEARCDAEAGQGDDYDPRELICGACSDVSRAQVSGTTVFEGTKNKAHFIFVYDSVFNTIESCRNESRNPVPLSQSQWLFKLVYG